MLDLLLLGPVSACVDGREYPVRGAKQRALLARLATSRGRPVDAGQLIADLWHTDGPRDPAHALQAQISRLRSTLPVEIEFRHGWYLLNPSTYRTDIADFERLWEQSRWLLAEGDLSQAGERLHEALGLWRGDAFEGLGAVAGLQIESVKLAKLRAAALADRIDVDIALGSGAAVVPELHALVDEHPFVERHWGQLMTALYGSGNANEALNVFSRARETLIEHLGIEPSGELRGLHLQILRGEPPESRLRLSAARTVAGESGYWVWKPRRQRTPLA